MRDWIHLLHLKCFSDVCSQFRMTFSHFAFTSASCVIPNVVGVLIIHPLWSFVCRISRVCPFLHVSMYPCSVFSSLEVDLKGVCRLNSKQNKRKLSISVVKQFLCHRKHGSKESKGCVREDSCNFCVIFHVISQHALFVSHCSLPAWWRSIDFVYVST